MSSPTFSLIFQEGHHQLNMMFESFLGLYLSGSANGNAAPLNQALSGQGYVHVNDLSGVSSNIVSDSE